MPFRWIQTEIVGCHPRHRTFYPKHIPKWFVPPGQKKLLQIVQKAVDNQGTVMRMARRMGRGIKRHVRAHVDGIVPPQQNPNVMLAAVGTLALAIAVLHCVWSRSAT